MLYLREAKKCAVAVPLSEGSGAEAAASALSGVDLAAVSFNGKELLIFCDSNQLSTIIQQLAAFCDIVRGPRPLGLAAIDVLGMSCGSCAARIEQALIGTTGVIGGNVSFAAHTARVWFDCHTTNGAALTQIVEKLGYRSSLLAESATLAISWSVSGMSCCSCAAHVESSLVKRPGVRTAIVSFPLSLATVWIEPSAAKSEDVSSWIEALGYKTFIPAQTAVLIREEEPRIAIQAPSEVRTQEVSFTVSGMSCGSCAAHIESSLLKRPGVKSASVNFASLSAKVFFDPQTTGQTEIAQFIAQLGYKATPQRGAKDAAVDGDGDVVLIIEGMSCAACASKIERELLKLTGVLSCTVNFALTTASVKLDPGAITETTVVDFVASLGYKARIVARLSSAAADETKKALERTREISLHWQRFINAFFFTFLIMGVMLVHHYTPAFQKKCGSFAAVFSIYIAEFSLATPVVLLFGWQFFEKAMLDFRNRALTMDTLVAFGVGGAYAFSTVTLVIVAITGDILTVSFDAAAMLLTFMLLGKYLEARAKRSTSSALIQLMSLIPQTAVVVLPTGDVTIPSAAIRKGQNLRVLSGERIPTDGVIAEGASDVDEQLVTGESVPRAVTVGDKVVGGTLNCQSVLIVEATRVGEDTMLAQVLRTVQEAQSSKPAIQRIADRIAGVFVPVVVCYAMVALLVWLLLGFFNLYPAEWRDDETIIEYSFQFFLATVVSACPCALGLATPTAIMVGTGVGARNGILIKAGTTLETCRNTTCVVLDKTGTITTGKQSVVYFSHESPSLIPPDVALGVLLSVTRLSNHPISKSVASFALDKDHQVPILPVINCLTVPGNGIRASVTLPGRLEPAAVLLGSPKFVQSEGVMLGLQTLSTIKTQQSSGNTTIVCCVDGEILYTIALSDAPKADAAAVVSALGSMDIKVIMVTGDSQGVAEAVGFQVGIPSERIHAHVLPDGKASIVRDLQNSGETVMFVGDGINDSPALATANVGVALGAGTDVAIEAADAVLIHSSLVDLITLIRLSQRTVRRIYGNFVWACAYNILMLPVAAGLLVPIWQFQLPPMVAGAAMVCSSLSVLGSSLQLRCFVPCTVKDLPDNKNPFNWQKRRTSEDREGLLDVNRED
jgi:Cu+-exporting ATPase